MRSRNTILIIFAAIIAMSVTATQAQAALISESQELSMGRDAEAQIEKQYRVSTDSRANALVDSMGRRLAAVSSRPNLPWKFKVLETSEVNAMSVPGYVYVNRGLLNFVGNDRDALAGVIGHEIGHTTARHAVRTAEKQLK
jgi:predicted Zn-dependent protease